MTARSAGPRARPTPSGVRSGRFPSAGTTMSMDQVYPAGPRSVPPDLTRPTRAYRTHAWLAMGGLAMFVLLYLALASWFSWTAYRLFASLAHGAEPLWTFVAGACSAFLAVFMWKAL